MSELLTRVFKQINSKSVESTADSTSINDVESINSTCEMPITHEESTELIVDSTTSINDVESINSTCEMSIVNQESAELTVNSTSANDVKSIDLTCEMPIIHEESTESTVDSTCEMPIIYEESTESTVDSTSTSDVESIDLTCEMPIIDEDSIDLTVDSTLTCNVKSINRTFQSSTLDESLRNSLFDFSNPKALIVYINEKDTIATEVFNQIIYSSDAISAYLAENFLVWEWNLIDENFAELLSIIDANLGNEIRTLIISKSKDSYPLFICLIFDHGQIQIEHVIENWMCENEIVSALASTIDAFNNRFDLPDTTGLHLTTIKTENWSMPQSRLILIENNSNEFQRVANDFDYGQSSIVHIHRIENHIWLLEYFKQKNLIDKRVGHDQTEKLLFHGCPYHSAEQILRYGFDHHRIGNNGSSFGRGFYFSSRRSMSDRYAQADPLTGEKRILMCRVLIGRNGLGYSSTAACPMNLDSTGNQSDVFVIYSNRHVLPEYLVTYK